MCSSDLAIYFDDQGTPMITGGEVIEELVFRGVLDGDEVIYSRFRHDFVEGKNGAWVDGGRDYNRWGGENPITIDFYVKNGEILFAE